MPVLEYMCPECKKPFEELVKNHEEKVFCPVCGREAERKWSGAVHSATGAKPKHCTGHCATCGGCK